MIISIAAVCCYQWWLDISCQITITCCRYKIFHHRTNIVGTINDHLHDCCVLLSILVRYFLSNHHCTTRLRIFCCRILFPRHIFSSIRHDIMLVYNSPNSARCCSSSSTDVTASVRSDSISFNFIQRFSNDPVLL